METDSLRLLRNRRAELSSKLEEARARLKAQEAEIHQIDVGIAAMEAEQLIAPTGNDASLRAMAYHARKCSPDAQGLTMKQLVLKALGEQFANGATANQMLEFFAREWGRTDITRTSLSPQLSRLKAEGKIALVGKTWMTRAVFDENYEAAPETAAGNLFPHEIGAAQEPPLNPPRMSAEPAHPKHEDHPSHSAGSTS